MALRFRRGNEVDRTDPSFVPEAGEPIWILNTQRLYVGDGSTPGGILVTGSGGGGGTPGIDDNTTGVVLTLDNTVSTFINDVELDSSDLILAGGSITGTGNINMLGNITASATITGNIANIGSLNVTAGINAGSIIAAPFFDGDLKGSVFGDDSTLIIDGISGNITTKRINSLTNVLTIDNNGSSTENQIYIPAVDNRALLNLVRTSNSDLTGLNTIPYGTIAFGRNDINGARTTGLILGRENALYFGVATDGDFSTADKFFVFSEGKIGIKNTAPTVELDVTGDAVISGSLTAGAILLNGSIIDTDDSSPITVTPAVTFNSDVTVENNLIVTNTLTVDTLEVANFTTAGSGTPELSSDTDILLTAGTRVEVTQSPLKMASFTTTERNALTPQNGDVIYNTTDSKFQGYAGGSWVNLH